MSNITFDLPQRARVSVGVYDLLGRRVMSISDRQMSAGARRTVQIDASSLSSGTYLYRLEAKMKDKRQVDTGRMTLIQ